MVFTASRNEVDFRAAVRLFFLLHALAFSQARADHLRNGIQDDKTNFVQMTSNLDASDLASSSSLPDLKAKKLLRNLQSSSLSSSSSSATSSPNGVQAQIVGGTAASQGEYMWFTLLYDSATYWPCGAFLVAPDILLSAAHCNGKLSYGLVGAYDLNTGSPNSVKADVITTVPHPQYNKQTLLNDVLVIKITPVTTITPAKINLDSSIPASGDSLTAMGFGYTLGNDDDGSHILLTAQMSEVSVSTCRSYYNGVHPNTQICAWNQNPIEITCDGDSGGPLIETSSEVVVGITSWVDGWGCKKGPGGFTRVSAYTSFFQDTICNMSAYPPSYLCSSSSSSAYNRNSTSGSSSTPAASPTQSNKKNCAGLSGSCKLNTECCGYANGGVLCNQTTFQCASCTKWNQACSTNSECCHGNCSAGLCT